MKQFKTILILVVLLLVTAGYAMADDFVIYPSKGQSNDQMDKDKYACYQWAKNQSGFDPMQQPKASAPPPQQEAPEGGVVGGAVKGGLLGVAVGAIAGDAGKGAAIGAASGGLVGGMRRHDQVSQQEQKQDQWANQQAQQYHQNRASYNKAYSACLEGKGYSVK
jgi:outer membrane lipoprotein SlyB